MVAAVVLAVLVMMVAAEPISAFVERHPTVKMLALSFLLLIGMSLVAEGFGQHIPKGYIYFAMGFSVFVEMINIRVRGKGEPVHLHGEPDMENVGSHERMRLAVCVRRVLACAFLLMSGALRRARRAYVPERVLRHRSIASSPTSRRCSPTWRGPTSCSSASSTTIRTRTGSSSRVLEGLARRRGDGRRSSLEMFERDVQEPLEHFPMGHIERGRVPEERAALARATRPTTSRSSISRSRRTGRSSPANVPRAIASEVAKSGLDALKAKPAPRRRWFAARTRVPVDDDYFERFAEAMGRHPADRPGPGSAVDGGTAIDSSATTSRSASRTRRWPSRSRARSRPARPAAHPLVVHFNGRVPQRLRPRHGRARRRRLPGKRVVVLSILPVANLDRLAPASDDRKRADYLVYTIK